MIVLNKNAERSQNGLVDLINTTAREIPIDLTHPGIQRVGPGMGEALYLMDDDLRLKLCAINDEESLPENKTSEMVPNAPTAWDYVKQIAAIGVITAIGIGALNQFSPRLNAQTINNNPIEKTLRVDGNGNVIKDYAPTSSDPLANMPKPRGIEDSMIKMVPQSLMAMLSSPNAGLDYVVDQSAPRTFVEKERAAGQDKHKRKFPWLPAVLIGGAAAAALYFLVTKKKNNNNNGTTDEVYTIRYWNHMMASPQKTLTKTLKPGTAIQATVSESGLSNVSQQYIAARYPDMGKLLGFGQDGTVNVVTASKNNTIDVYCFDTTHIDDALLGKIAGMSRLIVNGRNSKWYRRDFNGQSSDYQNLWDAAFQQVDAALQNPFPVGSCSAVGGVSGTDFSYGYGNVEGVWGDKRYNDKYIITDLNKILSANKGLTFAQEVNIEELFEAIPRLINLGSVNSKDVICSNGNLIEPGPSALRYAMIITQ